MYMKRYKPDRCVLAGDFNAHLGLGAADDVIGPHGPSTEPNLHGELLKQWLTSTEQHALNGRTPDSSHPTRAPDNEGEDTYILDLMVVDKSEGGKVPVGNTKVHIRHAIDAADHYLVTTNLCITKKRRKRKCKARKKVCRDKLVTC